MDFLPTQPIHHGHSIAHPALRTFQVTSIVQYLTRRGSPTSQTKLFIRSEYCETWTKLQTLRESSNSILASADFIAFDQRFFDIIGPNATVEQILVTNIQQSQEASCFIPTTKQLFYAEWSPSHAWQYLLDSETLELRNITTDPPTMNAHGCVYYDGYIYVATDGGEGHYASIVKIDPITLSAETVINNFFQQPFNGFNDIDADPNGNLWVTDSISAWVLRLLFGN
jgi:gluconolactonase